MRRQRFVDANQPHRNCHDDGSLARYCVRLDGLHDGGGVTASMIGNMSGTITQNGNTFSGGTNSCSGMFDHGHLSMHR